MGVLWSFIFVAGFAQITVVVHLLGTPLTYLTCPRHSCLFSKSDTAHPQPVFLRCGQTPSPRLSPSSTHLHPGHHRFFFLLTKDMSTFLLPRDLTRCHWRTCLINPKFTPLEPRIVLTQRNIMAKRLNRQFLRMFPLHSATATCTLAGRRPTVVNSTPPIPCVVPSLR